MKKIVATLCMLFMCGCASRIEPDYDTRVFFVDPGIRIQQLEARHYTREKDGHILVNISGIGETNQVVYYKVEWYDAYGMPIKTIMSSWKSASIVKNMPFDWSAVSPSPKATGFKIMISKKLGGGTLK